MDVMIDIETIATRNDAAVVSIGACAFARESDDVRNLAIEETFLVGIDPVYYDWRSGYFVDPETVKWWSTQPQEVQDALKINSVYTMRDALDQLHAWFDEVGFRKESRNNSNSRVWANPPQFDLTILRHAASIEYGSDNNVPWHYRQETCCRTHNWLHGSNTNHEDYQVARKGLIAHRADHDAIAQARMVQTIEQLRRGNG